MFNIFLNAWKVKDIRKKIFYVLLVLLIYRLGTFIPLPGLDLNALASLRSDSAGNLNMFAVIAGGGVGTLFVLGIGPYITASIIMQLLTVAIPKLEQIQKEGEEGRKKINQYTRVLAVALALLQGITTVISLQNLFYHRNLFVYIMATVAIVTGTILIMWISELLTEKGIGNGASFIIFANILSGLFKGVFNFSQEMVGADAWRFVAAAILLVFFVGLVAFVVYIQEGERRIPVQYAKKMVGRQMYGGQSSHIPIKVNIAGVMSIIFAISLLQFPGVILNFWPKGQGPEWLTSVVNVLSISNMTYIPLPFMDRGIYIPIGALVYILLIFCFTFFYTSFAINPVEMAENMKKSGGFVPGIRPGKPTGDYIQNTINRMSWIGAAFYSLIAIAPIILEWVFGFNLYFGGTTLLIVSGVAIEIVKQLESQLLMRHYKGFLS